MVKLILFILIVCEVLALYSVIEETERYFIDSLPDIESFPGIIREKDRDFFKNTSLIIWGATTEDEDEYDLNEYLAHNLVDFRIKRWLGQSDNVRDIMADTDLTVADVQEYNLILIGTAASNFWIQMLMPYLPIRIDDEGIIAGGRVFTGDEIGTSYRYPNPVNEERQLWIISAPSYEAIRFIPKVEDYCIYQVTDYNPNADRFLELALGNFTEDWQLEQLELVDNREIYSGEDDPVEIADLVDYPAPSWATRGVMYEIFVRSYYDSDGDGVGDLPGITAKLDYLNDGDPATEKDLGIELIWLMPIFVSPSYHGYDVSDYYQIEPDYGNNADFQELLQQAHRRGVKVITDLVLNHCSAQHPFFQDAYGNPESQYSNWFYFTNPSHTRAHNWQFRHRDKDRAMLDPYMPAWNVNNPAVSRYLFDMAKYWMDPNGDGNFSDGIDGFRCDYVKGPPAAFWMNFRQELKALNPEVLLLAENWDGMMSIAQSFDNQFDMAFDFPFQGSAIGSVSSANVRELINLIEEQREILPEQAIMNRFVNNHDMNRIFTRLSEEQARLSLTLLLLIPDMPMLYYGDEIGMRGEKDPYDEGIRRPMEWCADNDCPGMTNWYPVWNSEPDRISVEEEENDPASILSMVKELIRLRHSYPALEKGEINFFRIYAGEENTDKEYIRAMAFVVYDESDYLLVIANLHEARELVIDVSGLSEIKEISRLFGPELYLERDKATLHGTFAGQTVYLFELLF